MFSLHCIPRPPTVHRPGYWLSYIKLAEHLKTYGTLRLSDRRELYTHTPYVVPLRSGVRRIVFEAPPPKVMTGGVIFTVVYTRDEGMIRLTSFILSNSNFATYSV